MNIIDERIHALREAMQTKGFDAIILPSNDPHQSEYVSDYWKIRAHFSGFSGSAGTLIVTADQAALWVDSRYFTQVENQCADTCIQMHKQSIPHAPEHIPWLSKTLSNNSTIAIDFRLFSFHQMEYLSQHISSKNISVDDLGGLIDTVWMNRPESASAAIVDHPIDYCGESRVSKLEKIRAEMLAENADFHFLSSLDDICWLLNIRSTDVDFTPLVTAYALVGKSVAQLFIHDNRLDSELAISLENDGVKIESYNNVRNTLEHDTHGKRVITDGSLLNYACYQSTSGELMYKPSLAQHLKSIKNDIEIENAKNGMLKDGIALTKFFMWLESHLKDNTISEFELGQKLESFRKEQPLYMDQSFSAIAGYKENGAIIHYSAPKEGSSRVSNNGILLLDSGAQYFNATTDITRTVWLGGTPSEEEQKAYTLVFKGYVELDSMIFPKGTAGIQLDAFARMHLWKHGLNYGHGTGHGIGVYGMVHEPAQGFTPSNTTIRGATPHLEGQLTTIEPGYYKVGEYGIRTENVVLSKVVNKTEHGVFIGFEAITLFPIDPLLLDQNMLLEHEINWLNTYHSKVFNSLKDHLNSEEQEWLRKKCTPIS